MWGGFKASCMSAYLSVYLGYLYIHHTSLHPHMSVHLPIHQGDIQAILTYVRHCCVYQYIHVAISSSIACQQLYNCGHVIPVDQHHCWSLPVSCMAGFSSYVLWVLFLLLCFCLFGLEAYGCMLRLHAVDLF